MNLSLPSIPKLIPKVYFKDILELYRAFRRGIVFQPEDLIAAVQTPDLNHYRNLAAKDLNDLEEQEKSSLWNIGSNNWVINGEHTQSGYPIMANDPHRTQAAPSLQIYGAFSRPWDGT